MNSLLGPSGWSLLRFKPAAHKLGIAWSRFLDLYPNGAKVRGVTQSAYSPDMAYAGSDEYAGSSAPLVWLIDFPFELYDVTILSTLCFPDSSHSAYFWTSVCKPTNWAIPLWWTVDDFSKARANAGARKVINLVATFEPCSAPVVARNYHLEPANRYIKI